MLVRLLLILFFIFVYSYSFSLEEEDGNYYWIQFSDKNGTQYSIDKPEEFLSAKAIQRRQNQRIEIDESDLPISQVYLDSIANRNIKVVHTSKWMNGATVIASPSQIDELLATFQFIESAELTKPAIPLKSTIDKFADENSEMEIDSAYYGGSVHQVGQLNGQFLHNNGFLGQGMHIAVLDAGFFKVNEQPSLLQLISERRIYETRDFVNPGSDVFLQDDHGMNVLSTMAGELPGQLIGTAPKANYYLFRSEDAETEFKIEADSWIVAAEYADSLGVDIINSSLGYSEFEDSSMDFTYQELDGKTTRVTRAANMAAEKGILVISSAGNEANDPWKYLVAPSDGDLVIGVGAVNKDGIWASFSSLGPASDGDVKPNVVATGWGSYIQKANGEIGLANGTSFSAPILTGMAACLWQAYPLATNLQIKDAIEKSSSQYKSPDDQLGYGIPDFEKASEILQDLGIGNLNSEKYWSASKNPFNTDLEFKQIKKLSEKNVTVTVLSASGNALLKKIYAPGNPIVFRNLSNLPSGVYFFQIESDGAFETHKLLKINTK